MTVPLLEIRDAGAKGRGLFAVDAIPANTKLLDLGGKVFSFNDMPDGDDWMALQIGDDQWLCSQGTFLDDFANHSCDPNAGFTSGELSLWSLREIGKDEEITWDYSTSINEPGWSLDCRCGAVNCRKQAVPWCELTPAERERLRPIAMPYLKTLDVTI
jgi:SET domain-containing protein